MLKPANAKKSSTPVLQIRPSKVALLLGVVILVLATLSTVSKLALQGVDADSWRGLREIALRFDLDGETTVPAWFSSALLFASASLLGLIAWMTRRCGGRFFWYWTVLAATFLYLSLDESACLHEILIVPIRRRLGTTGILYFAWVIPGFFIVLLFGLSYLRFLWQLPRRSRNLFIAAGCTFVGGALGLEFVGGALAEAFGFDALAYVAVMTMEETLEMTGLAIFICALLDYLGERFPMFQAQFHALRPLADEHVVLTERLPLETSRAAP